MSLRTRARNLQRVAGVGYQQAIARLRDLGETPAALARRTGWPLARCDAFCVDRALDDEWREVTAGSTSIDERACAACKRLYFAGDAERFTAEHRCPACRLVDVPTPTREVRPSTMRSALQRLLENACARTVMWVPRKGAIVQVGLPDTGRVFAVHAAAAGAAFEDWPETLGRALVLEDEGVHIQFVGAIGVLVVVLERGSSVGLLRLAVRKALADIARLATSEEPFVPPSGGSGPSGAPAQVAAGLATWRWSAPVSDRREDPS